MVWILIIIQTANACERTIQNKWSITYSILITHTALHKLIHSYVHAAYSNFASYDGQHTWATGFWNRILSEPKFFRLDDVKLDFELMKERDPKRAWWMEVDILLSALLAARLLLLLTARLARWLKNPHNTLNQNHWHGITLTYLILCLDFCSIFGG